MVPRVGHRILLALLLLGAVLVISPDGQLARITSAQNQVTVTITVSGLPESRSASLFEARSNLDGSYSIGRLLGRLNGGQLTAKIDAGSFVAADPVMVSDNERYAVKERFLAPPADGRLVENYRHEFSVTAIVWTHGAIQPGGSTAGARDGGTISPPPGWYPAGSQVRLVAKPAVGFKFLHWGVFGVSERVDVRTVTATGAQLDVNMDRPLRVVAAFGA